MLWHTDCRRIESSHPSEGPRVRAAGFYPRRHRAGLCCHGPSACSGVQKLDALALAASSPDATYSVIEIGTWPIQALNRSPHHFGMCSWSIQD